MHKANSNLLNEILETVPDGSIENIVIGKHWTAVSLYVRNTRLCGLASTIQNESPGWDGHFKAVSKPANEISAKLLASKLSNQHYAEHTALSSIAAATLNALLQYPFSENLTDNRLPFKTMECNAEDLIIRYGKDHRVAVIGHFPFTDRIKSAAGHLDVLEFDPKPGDLPADAAPDVIPKADMVAITGMTWINGTLESLLTLCAPSAVVIVLGASTPLSPVLFSRGIQYLCGALVKDIDPVMQAVANGLVYRQIIPAGLQLITIHRQEITQQDNPYP